MKTSNKIPTVLINVSGGVVQEIVSDCPVCVVVVDWDNIEAGQTDRECPYGCMINKKRIKEILKEANEAIDKNEKELKAENR